MRAEFVVILCIASQEPAKVCFIEYDAVIDALATDRADQALGVRILPRGPSLSDWAGTSTCDARQSAAASERRFPLPATTWA
jgi:hypothetical protein